METLHPRRTPDLVPSFGNLYPTWRRRPRHTSIPSFRRGNVSRRRGSPRPMSFPDIFKMRHLASTIGIRNMPEEAHHESSAEGQYPAAPLSPTRWTGTAGERRGDEDGSDPGWGMSYWRDPEFGPWLLGYEVLRDVEAHWPNEVGKWRVGRRNGKMKFSANL